MNWNNFIDIVKLLRPQYYNRITWLLITAAVPLLTTPLWIDIVNIILGEIKIGIIGRYDSLIGVAVIIIALIYNTVHKYIVLRYETPNEPAYKKIKQNNIPDFGALCQQLLPIIRDNEYIFKNCGPNSNATEVGELRTDLTVWNNLKKDSIIPNNNAIKNLIEQNKDLIPNQYQDIFNKLILHIKAFDMHVKNPNFDYTQHQFPKDISEIITRTCYNYAKDNKRLKHIQRWLSKKIKSSHIENGFLIGSILLYPQEAKDADIVII